MKPVKGSYKLRSNRFSLECGSYFITTSVAGKKPLLATTEAAKIVMDSLSWLEEREVIYIHAYVIMHDNVHLIFQLKSQNRLDEAMRLFKRYTRRVLAEKYNTAPFWQEGYYDHFVRNENDFWECVEYIQNNPLKKELVKKIEDYPFIKLPEQMKIT